MNWTSLPQNILWQKNWLTALSCPNPWNRPIGFHSNIAGQHWLLLVSDLYNVLTAHRFAALHKKINLNDNHNHNLLCFERGNKRMFFRTKGLMFFLSVWGFCYVCVRCRRLYLTRLNPFIHRGCSGVVWTCEVELRIQVVKKSRSQGAKKSSRQEVPLSLQRGVGGESFSSPLRGRLGGGSFYPLRAKVLCAKGRHVLVEYACLSAGKGLGLARKSFPFSPEEDCY